MSRESIERTIFGNHVRVTIERLGDGFARVIEYERTRPCGRAETVKHLRGRVLPLAQLGVSEARACLPATVAWRTGGTP